jgi:putative Mg2+ transporter-C (MgtC) family protein
MATPFDCLWNPGDGRILLRLLIAAAAGGIVGWNRFRAGKPAGIGTHALVAMGAALFVAAPIQWAAGQDPAAVTRVVQGIATGVGFLGAGEIFRDLQRPDRVHGLTSAAALWVTAALGIVAGCGSVLLVFAATGMVVLVILGAPHLERRGCATPGNGPL